MAHGEAPMQAGHVATAFARAEATGNVNCGYYLESYCAQLASVRVSGTVFPVVTKPRLGAIKSDAKSGFAQPAFAAGLDEAIKAAADNGIASLAVSNAQTCTSLGFFAEQIAARGMVGIGMTNASPVVAPPGGNKAVIRTNPLAMTVPGKPPPALHFDFSTSPVALGKITMVMSAGEPIPLGWAFDADGKPATYPGAALKGALVSAGGYKGWGFGLMVELLAAGMTGYVNSLDVEALKLPDSPAHGLGQFYILMDPSTYGPHFTDRFARMAEAVAEEEGARIPGADRKVMTEIDVPDALWALVERLARD